MQRAHIREDVLVLADRHDALALIRMTEMREDDLHARMPQRHRLDQSRQREGQRCLRDEGRAHMQQHRQPFRLRVAPQRLQPLVIRAEARIHRHQLDPAEPQLLATHAHLAFPALLRRIQRHEADQAARIPRHILSHRLVIHPQAAQTRLSAENNRPRVLRSRRAIRLIRRAHVHLHPRPRPTRLMNEILRKVGGEVPGVGMDVDDHGEVTLLPRSSGQTAAPPRGSSPHPA